jgi:GNAT superfamily N-acetyltransferase
MPDMLVRLYALPAPPPPAAAAAGLAVELRVAHPTERALVADWVGREFGPRWARECAACFDHRPVTCQVAVELPAAPRPASGYDLQPERLVGFACHDVVARGMFGPTGVAETHRGRGIGSALLHASLLAMREQGYAYAVIARVGPIEFYRRAVGATVIEGSEPGVYRGRLEVERSAGEA